MATNRTPIAREPRGRISADQRQALWLGHPPGAFASEADEAAAWAKHRASMLHLFGRHGHRPIAWWRHDPEASELTYPGYDSERSYLFEAGVLSEVEAATLVKYWKLEFQKAHAPGFTLCMGEGQWLKGREAREAHMAWADIPASLVKRWTAERRATIT